jgi:hypothetical protein
MDGADGKKGKLFVLLDTFLSNREVVTTGLEDLLSQYGIRLEANPQPATDPSEEILPVVVMPETALREPHPIGGRFSRRDRVTLFAFRNPRQINPLPGGNPTMRPSRLVVDYPTAQNTYGVTVSETAPTEGNPHAETPRLVVVGASSWASDMDINFKSIPHANLFLACVSWLCQRQDFVGAPSKPTDEYMPDIGPNAGVGRLVWLPLLLTGLLIVSVGGGVWVVRRR